MDCASSTRTATMLTIGGTHVLGRLFIAMAVVALVAACDTREQQKPKVEAAAYPVIHGPATSP